MNKCLKVLLIIFLTIIGIYALFIIEESTRLKINSGSKPLIIIDRTKYCVSCIIPGENLDVEYLSLGFKLKVNYYLSEESSDDNKQIIIISEEFLLLNKYRLWAWIQ